MTTLSSLLKNIKIGRAAKHHSLTMFPILAPETPWTNKYLVLDEALATGAFRIQETSESGSVPELLAENDTPSFVFLLDGEELVGAKQNRVLNLSLMLAPCSKTRIPVSCVEAGRWRYTSHSFKGSDRAHFARGRAQKVAQVSSSLESCGTARSDQGAVWDAIDLKLKSTSVRSDTGAMSDLFESSRPTIDEYRVALEPARDQIGAAFFIGGTLLGVEVFDSPATFRKLSHKLVASYAVDAMESTVEPLEEKSAVDDVAKFLNQAILSDLNRLPTQAVGDTLRLDGSELIGAALEVHDHCVHLCAFRRELGRPRRSYC